MSSRPPTNRFFRKPLYAAVMLLTAVIGTLAQVVVVPPAWNWWPYERQETTATKPASSASPTRQSNVCGTWVSASSGKRYDFVCQGQGAFEIYEISDQGLSKNGSGKLTEEGIVEADLLSMPKNRIAHLRLGLSADGRSMEGAWHGDDPRESGQLMLQRR